MKTITLNRARYTVRDDRDIMGDLMKITGKHKPIKSKGAERRMYPTEGATLSTAAYVAQYYGLNSTSRNFKTRGTNSILPGFYGGGAPYGTHNSLEGFYEGLSDRLSVPGGVDSLEVEA